MESFIEVFNLVKEFVKERVSDVAYSCWIAFIEPVKFEDNKAIIYIKTAFQRDILQKQYMDKIKDGFNAVLGFPIEVIIATEDDINEYIGNEFLPNQSRLIAKDPDIAPPPQPKIDHEGGNYEYTFDTFIVGASNNFAYAACKAIATQQSGSYNPLFIYGPSGLGKTHLLSAISNEIKKTNPDKNIISISSESFTNELIAAIGTKTINSFHNKYRKADILLVDDIQFIAGKESTQEEFFHTFNELYQVGKQIVLTSDRPPKDIKTLEDRLKSRFEWGLLTDISPPDFETRIAIINRKADLLQIEIPADVSEFIANRLKTNIRQLEGAVKKIKAYKLLAGSPPSINVAQTVIKEILNDNQPVPVTVERIIEEVAKTYSVTPEDIRSNKRSAQISTARQAAIYIVREITQMSLAPIGEEFGGRDHSTIVYALRQVEKQMQTDSRQKGIIEDIIKNIRNK
ncbi:chromosomal replication initiator protein DnaA [Paludicola sp. MB14-C6]|uniref:chromosomal replication initiator protein DnaA n=1 Tax=Paludihabitans sp. MB14-C6 TaxID=3070656 RepID=UPI0027DB107C|nr:chromosomal replication initiator protein DnaA [Paludicola sp. MB14-C6]WMJ21788.1 chromosomal replication initiator protein DnaA [Paludicola sp. MB14-C6]